MKKEVQIIGLSYSQSQPNAYVVVLSEVGGNRKLPIVIKAQDAQTVALKLEKLKLPRPMTHDLFKHLCDGYRVDVPEVFIYNVLEGVFFCKIVTNNGVDDLDIESTIGDALALSLTFGSTLYVDEEVLSKCGIKTSEDGTVIENKHSKKKSKKEQVVSIEDLKRMMEDAIKNEEYEVAAELRDKITKLESK